MPSVINLVNKTGFIHIPRTSGFTYSEYLLNTDSNNQKFVKTVFTKHYSNFHIAAFELEQYDLELTTIIRNPYDRFISSFITTSSLNLHSYLCTTEGLDKVIDDDFLNSDDEDLTCFFKSMVYYTHSKDLKTNLVKNIIRFEDIISSSIYDDMNNDNKSTINSFELSSKAIEYINNLYDCDFVTFNYDKK